MKTKKSPTQKSKFTETERAFAEALLGLLYSDGFEFTEDVAINCLVGARLVRDSLQRQVQEQHTRQEERQHRDSLQGQMKVDYVVERLKKEMSIYGAPYQDEEILPLALKEQQVSKDWKHTHDTLTYIKGNLENILGGCSKSFRQKVVAKYRAEVLPELFAKYEKEKNEQDAMDEFASLMNDKTPEEIRTMTKLLRKAA